MGPLRPVILVHGIFGNRHLYWNLFRHRLRADGVRFHEVVLPAGLLGDMRIAAGVLRAKVDATLRGDGVPKVDLVCHSAGGLVARDYLKFLDGAKHVDRLVLMGAPNQGTHVARLLPLAPIAMRRQASPGSNFLREIDGPVPPGVTATNLWSPVDGIVVPSRNAILEGAKNVELAWVHHWGMLLHRSVYDAVLAGLGRESATKPQP